MRSIVRADEQLVSGKAGMRMRVKTRSGLRLQLVLMMGRRPMLRLRLCLKLWLRGGDEAGACSLVSFKASCPSVLPACTCVV